MWCHSCMVAGSDLQGVGQHGCVPQSSACSLTDASTQDSARAACWQQDAMLAASGKNQVFGDQRYISNGGGAAPQNSGRSKWCVTIVGYALVLMDGMQVPCTAAAAACIRTCMPGGEQLLLNPDLAAWAMAYAGRENDWQMADWLLQLVSSQAAIRLRAKYTHLYDRAWVAAAGHAAAGRQHHLMAALGSMPTAPGQLHGLTTLDVRLQAELLCAAAAAQPAAAAEALAEVMGLCRHCRQDKSQAVGEEPDASDSQAEQQAALTLAAQLLVQRGQVHGLGPLLEHGLQMTQHLATQLFVATTLANKRALLLKLVNLELPDQQQLGDTAIGHRAIKAVWSYACAGMYRPACQQQAVDTAITILTVQPYHCSRKLLSRLIKCGLPEPLVLALLGVPPLRRLYRDHHMIGVMLQGVKSGYLGVIRYLLTAWQEEMHYTVLSAASRTSQPVQTLTFLMDQAYAACHHASGQLCHQRLERLLSNVAQACESAASELAAAAVAAGTVSRRHACPQSATFHALLSTLVEHCGCRQLQCAYFGYGVAPPLEAGAAAAATMSAKAAAGPKMDEKLHSIHRLCCASILGALCGLGMDRLATILIHNTPVPFQDLCSRPETFDCMALMCARRPATHPNRNNILIAALHAGVNAADIIKAVYCTYDVKLLLSVLTALDAQQQAAHTAWCCDNGRWRLDSEDKNSRWPEHMVQFLARQACGQPTSQGQPEVMAAAWQAVQLLLTAFHIRPCTALIVPVGAKAGCLKLQARHYKLLSWLLQRFGAAAVLQACEANKCNTSEDAPFSPIELLVCNAPSSFINLLLKHGADSSEVLAALCKRPNVPLHAVHAMLNGYMPDWAKPSSNSRTLSAIATSQQQQQQPVQEQQQQPVQLQERPDVHWQQDQCLDNALQSGQSTELVDLLIAQGADWQAALTRSAHSITSDMVNHLLRKHRETGAQPLAYDVLCAMLKDAPSSLAATVLAADVDPNDALVGCCSAGAAKTCTVLLDVYGADAAYMNNKPVITAAEHDHLVVVELLLQRGACQHAALYGAALGGHVPLARMLLEPPDEVCPLWAGRAMTTAVMNGDYTMVELLLPYDDPY